MYDVWCTLMYINVHHPWWCKMMYIIFYIMMYGGATSRYIMMHDAHHIWCEVMHIIIKYDSKWCASSHIICDVHHKYIWCIMMCNDFTSFFFQIFFLRSSIPASFFFSDSLPRVGRTTTLHFIISTTLLFSLIWALVSSTHN